MADQVTYPVPVGGYSRPGTGKLEPREFGGSLNDSPRWFECRFYGDDGTGIRYEARWEGSVAVDIITRINTGSFDGFTFRRWISEKALADAKIPQGGTAS